MSISLPDTSRPMLSLISDDKLSGVAAIATFIGESHRRTQYLLERKMIPAGKTGAIWTASKRVLLSHYERITAGQAA